MPARMSIAIFHPMAHFPRAYDSGLTPKQRLQGRYLEHKVRRWRARPDSHALFTNEPVAAEIWSHRRGAPVYWSAEPQIVTPSLPPGERRGCLLFGAIDKRKGFDLLADAISLAPTATSVRIAGRAAPSILGELKDSVERMRAAGAEVELELDFVDRGGDPLLALSQARCAVLPYRTHFGISRVLFEAALAGTPVVGPSWGATGHRIREYGLGLTADPTDPAALRQAILNLIEDPEAPETYGPALADYAEKMGGRQFRNEIRRGFGLDVEELDERRAATASRP